MVSTCFFVLHFFGGKHPVGETSWFNLLKPRPCTDLDVFVSKNVPMGIVKGLGNIYLEPICPLFLGLNPSNEGLFQSKQGSFGFQVYNSDLE